MIIIIIIIKVIIFNNLREVGALPEYASREGCGVEVPDSGKAARKEKSRSWLRVA